jgi:pimeloyl-ACP methyl ester carboxylesterase
LRKLTINLSVNYYRTRETNHYDEMTSLKGPAINVPVLFIPALQDQALPLQLSNGMERFIPQLTLTEVDASHWTLWEDPGKVNGILTEWIDYLFPMEA